MIQVVSYRLLGLLGYCAQLVRLFKTLLYKGDTYKLFEHENFDNYEFENIPLNCDLYVMDEVFIKEYENSLLKLFDGGEHESIGCVSYVGARKVNENSVELSWYPNFFDRFHEVSISLPKEQFVTCVGSWVCEEKPRIFVKRSWLENIHLRSYSVFGLIDAIGVKDALESGAISREKLVLLRGRIDVLSEQYPEISFISFADSLLIKSNWFVGHSKSSVTYTYEPEIFIRLIEKIESIYEDVLNLSIYAVLTQGSNEYYDDSLLHISDSKNHISLNSLGIPFAQLMSIDGAVRSAIRQKLHKRAELYMDKHYYYSLRFKRGFDKNAVGKYTYKEKMMGTPSTYYFASREHISGNLRQVDRRILTSGSS